MQTFEKENYPVFDMFNNQWALVTAGDASAYNACTLSWGSLGTIWGSAGQGRPIVTVYVHPDRYTHSFLTQSEVFTVSFFSAEYKQALAYLGSHSGREENKIAAAGLTPKPIGNGITYKEATLTFLCKKLYQAPFLRSGMAEEISNSVYQSREPHWIFMGEIMEVEDRE